MARQIIVEIVGDADKFSKTLDGATKSGAKFGAALGAGAAVGKAAFGVLDSAIGTTIGFVTDSIKNASDLNETVSKVGVVFGAAGDDVIKWGEDSAKAMGMSKNAALAAAGTYGNLFVSMGITGDKAAGMSKEMVQLAGDMASFNNASPEETLQAIQSGLTGETEPLRRFGVNLNAASIEAEAVSLGLAKTTVNMNTLAAAQLRAETAQKTYNKAVKEHGANSAEAQKASVALGLAEDNLGKVLKGKMEPLSAAAKAQASYSLILKQSGTAQGDFARTSDGLANQQRIAAAEMENLSAKIGQALLPVVVKIEHFLVESVIPAFFAVADAVGPIISVIGELVGTIIGALMPVVKAMLPVFQAVFGAIGAVVKALGPVMRAIAQVVAGVVNTIMAVVKALAPGFKIVFGILANIVGSWIKGLQAAFKVVATVIGVLQKVFQALGTFVGKVFSTIGSIVRGVINAIIGIVNSVIRAINRIQVHIHVGPVDLDFNGLNIPTIPRLHSGGVVPGSPGTEVLTILEAGETVTPRGGAPGGQTINIHIDSFIGSDSDIDRFANKVALRLRTA